MLPLKAQLSFLAHNSQHEFQSDEIQTVTAQWDRPLPAHFNQRRHLDHDK